MDKMENDSPEYVRKYTNVDATLPSLIIFIFNKNEKQYLYLLLNSILTEQKNETFGSSHNVPLIDAEKPSAPLIM